jgi:hypothetical protein
MLSGVGEHILDEFEKTGLIKTFGRRNVFKATDRAGESTLEALAAAEQWLEDNADIQPETANEDAKAETSQIEENGGSV